MSSFDEKLARLESSVSDLSTESSYSLKDKSQYVFMSIPLLVAFTLYFMKFGFITTTDEEGKTKINRKAFMKWVLALSAALCGGFYYYINK